MKHCSKIIVLCILATIIGCSAGGVGDDPSNNANGNSKIVKEAKKYEKGNPEFFIPTNADLYSILNITKNTSGAVAWTGSAFLGMDNRIESLTEYRKRLNDATIENQSSYSQYRESISSGHPCINEVNRLNQAGFCCFVLVYRIYEDASVTMVPRTISWNCDTFLSDNAFVEVSSDDVKIGDVVAYDFDKDNSVEHIGIVISTNYAEFTDYTIFSSLSTIELHKFGARQTRLGAYSDKAHGGAYDHWGSNFNNPRITF